MRKTILILLLIVTANPAWADWSEIFKGRYIDQTNIRKNGHFVKVWELSNVKEKEAEIASFLSLEEYNCKEEKGRTLSAKGFPSKMGSGIPLLEVNEPGEWVYFQPWSPADFTLQLVCHEWVEVVEDLYFDPIAIRKNGQFVSFWVLLGNTPRDSKGARSVRTLYEYDCKRLKKRRRAMSSHSDPMAFGNVVYKDITVTEWASIDEGESKKMLSIICD